jgi:hypothetical protein
MRHEDCATARSKEQTLHETAFVELMERRRTKRSAGWEQSRTHDVNVIHFDGALVSLLQMNPPIPVITPKGDGYAHVLIDYGAELLWVVFLDDSGECWTYDNTQIRAQKNVTIGRTHVSMHRAPGMAAESD